LLLGHCGHYPREGRKEMAKCTVGDGQ
jgi:hypothetical protein